MVQKKAERDAPKYDYAMFRFRARVLLGSLVGEGVKHSKTLLWQLPLLPPPLPLPPAPPAPP